MKKFLGLVLILSLTGCGNSNDQTSILATATIYSVSSTDATNFTIGEAIGSASLIYSENQTTMDVNVSGLTANTSHAMHLHMGTLETPSHHWNQGGSLSFCQIWNKPFAGDVGNLQIDENGNGAFSLSTDLWSLNTESSSDVVGTVLFIHENSEDFQASCSASRVDHTNTKIAGGTIVLQ